ncbi:hypothetical protein D1007_31773 [Hordeum vulgare]|nr:hypothetical protein D1007_31773 [Hordeum vulgare]
MRQIPNLVAKKLLEKLNKEGVMYKPAAVVPSCNNDGDDEVASFENGPHEKKEFVYKEDNESEDGDEPVIGLMLLKEAVPNKKNEAKEGGSPTKSNNECGATPENPWIIGNSPQAASSDIDIVPSYVSKFMANAKKQKLATIVKDDEVISGKRKHMFPEKFVSPYALDKVRRRPARALFSDNEAPEVVADEWMSELIDAAITFVEIAYRCEKNKLEVIDSYQVHLVMRIGHDHHLCPTWKSKFLVDRALARDKPLMSCHNMDSELSRSGAASRVRDEYTLCDKTYVALNIGNTHLMTVVMHMRKKEFQVLDSLYPLKLCIDTVRALVLSPPLLGAGIDPTRQHSPCSSRPKKGDENRSFSDKSTTNIHHVDRAKPEKERDVMKQERDTFMEERDLMKLERDHLKQEKNKLEYMIGDLFKHKVETTSKIRKIQEFLDKIE